MQEQSVLPGIEAPTGPTDRLFLALFPDESAAAATAGIAQALRVQHGLRGKPLQTGRFHVTLFHLGDYAGIQQDVLTAATRAAEGIKWPPFQLAFDRAESFSSSPRNRPLVLRGDQELSRLMDFQQTLGEALKREGLAKWVKPGYTPHMTLLYDDRVLAAQAVEPVAWTAHELVLVHSLLGQSRHLVAGRWPLTA
jgi:2'-5' RNA ligase